MKRNVFSLCYLLSIACCISSCNTEDVFWDEPSPVVSRSLDLLYDDLLIASSHGKLTADEAVCVSDLFMKRENIFPVSRLARSNRNSVEVLPIKGTNGDTVAYVVNYTPTGFSVISATKKYSPILAFSDEGSITPDAIANTGLGYWLYYISEDIIRAEAEILENTLDYAEIRSEWMDYEKKDLSVYSSPETGSGYYWFLQIHNDIMGEGGIALIERNNYYYQSYLYGINLSMSGLEEELKELDRRLAISYANTPPVPPSFVWSEHSVGVTETKYMPLLKTYWSQGEPYNNLLPPRDVSDGKTGNKVAGCVTVAVAQILNYHSFPQSLDGVVIDWTKTQVKYASAYDIEVPKLIQVVNVGVKTKNGDTLSVARTTDAQSFLVNNHYQANIYDNNWEEIIENEIKASRPVYMSARRPNTSVGHAWVCDGFYSKDQTRKLISYKISDTRNQIFSSSPYFVYKNSTRNVNLGKFYHMNWGWGYMGTELDPSDLSNNSGGWYRSIFDTGYNELLRVMQIIPIK